MHLGRWFFVLGLCLAGQVVLAEEASDPDPWEGYNRAMYSFNSTVDRYTLRPLAKGYVYVTPKFVRQGVTNVFNNVGEVPNILNGILQGQPGQATKDTGRLLVNSTIGLAGLFDVAKHMGMKPGDGEDFGQTMAVWGVAQGPYIVLPFLGPSTVRDTFAIPADWYSDPRTYIDHIPTKNTARAAGLLDTRAGLLDLERHITGDEYTFVRDAFLQRREFLVKNGAVEDDFGDDDFGDDEDYGY